MSGIMCKYCFRAA